MREMLRQVPLFAELSEEDLARVCTDVEELVVDAGTELFREGDEGDAAYIVTDGRVEISRLVAGRDTVFADRGAGEVIGEGALLRAAPRAATVRTSTPARLLRVPRAGIEALLASSPKAARSLYDTLVERLTSDDARLKQVERMAQLGTLAAGVAHELNNPAAAVLRAAEQLSTSLEALDAAVAAAAGRPDVLDAVDRIRDHQRRPPSDTLAVAEAEQQVEAWLEERGVPDPWRYASGLVQLGLEPGALTAEVDGLEPDRLTATVGLVVASGDAKRTASEIAEGARRLSGIVGAMRSHSHLDRAVGGQVDLHRGIDDTVTLLAHRLRGITVERDYDPDLPSIGGDGGALNQVWTNLLHNAADALHDAEVPDPRIRIRTRREGELVVVEIEDDGPGVAPEVRDRIFDAFFTTKPPGAGTGLGLHVTREIVVRDHGGHLDLESAPGRTVFRVTLPVTCAPGLPASGAAAAPAS